MAIYQPQDKFYRKAHEQGLPSRAAFKLRELLARYRLVGRDTRVLDLGCAPGGWMAVLDEMVSGRGKVVGIDLAACRPPSPAAAVITGNAADQNVVRAALDLLGGPADLITSDMAPKLSGIRARDEARCEELVQLALEVAAQTLRPGGSMIVKLFMGGGFAQTTATFRGRFKLVDIARTKATRPGSRELYLVGRDFGALQL